MTTPEQPEHPAVLDQTGPTSDLPPLLADLLADLAADLEAIEAATAVDFAALLAETDLPTLPPETGAGPRTGHEPGA